MPVRACSRALLMPPRAFVAVWESIPAAKAGVQQAESFIGPRFLSVMSRNVSNYLSVVVSRDGLITDVFALQNQRFRKGR